MVYGTFRIHIALNHAGRMPDSEITERHLHAFRRFISLLPSGKELDLVILKAHLLIEEQVNVVIDQRLKSAGALKKARLESFQRICLAESFFPSDFQPWLWPALTKLNKLRNDIAHQISPAGIDASIDHIIKSVPGASDIGAAANTRQGKFEITLWSLFDAVSELVESRKASVVEIVNRDKA